MEKPSLDNTDLKILTLLAKNGRVSYRTIAHAIDLTTKSVKSRVDRMLEARVIEKFIAFINPSVAGYHKTYSFALRKGMLNPELFERINLVGEIQYRFEVMGGVVGFAIAIREEDEDKMNYCQTLSSLQSLRKGFKNTIAPPLMNSQGAIIS